VLSLAKLAGSDQRYFLDQAQRRVDHTESVASGAEDYYLTGPEAAGEWSGSATGDLGLRGQVSEQALRAVLTRHDPRSALPLEGSVQRARVPGFDLMFSVPKSASILFGIGSADFQKPSLTPSAPRSARRSAISSGMRAVHAKARAVTRSCRVEASSAPRSGIGPAALATRRSTRTC
jgi:hypothetical protein